MSISSWATIATVSLTLLAVSPAIGDTQYRDPKRRFTISIPAGWQQKTQDNNLQLSKGRAFVNLLILPGGGTADGTLSALASQIGGQWKNFKVQDRGECRFGGQTGACMGATGVNPAGVAAFMMIDAVVTGGAGYAMILSGPMDEANNLGKDLQQIADSFLIGSGPGGTGATAPDTRSPAGGGAAPSQAGWTEFQAPDGSFVCRVPPGWRTRSTATGATPLYIFEPEGGGEERILVATGAVTVSDIQQLADQTITFVTQQLLPGLRVASRPVFTQIGGNSVAEISYSGVAGTGQVIWWQGVMLKGGTYYTVLGGARAQQAQAMEKQSRTVFGSIRPGQTQGQTAGQGQASSQLARYVIGRWTWFNRQRESQVSTSKQITFYPNGRYDYIASTFVPNAPTGVDPTTQVSGSYKLNGNTLMAQSDRGDQGNFTLEMVPPNGLKISGDLFIRE